jgi:hypothetical protein
VTANVEGEAYDFVHDALGHGEDVDTEEREVEVLVNGFDTLESVDFGVFDLVVFDDFEVIQNHTKF